MDRCQDSSAVRFLRIDHVVSGSNPPLAKLLLRVRRVASSVIPGVGITSSRHIDRKDMNIAR